MYTSHDTVYIALLTLECWYSPQLLIRLLFCHPGSCSGPIVKIQVKRFWRWFRGLIRSMFPYHHLPLGNPHFCSPFSEEEIQNPGVCSRSPHKLHTLIYQSNVFVFPLWKMEDYVWVSERQGEDLGGGILEHNEI